MKLDDVDQTLWDIFKVANALELPSVEAAYLIVAAPRSSWIGALEVVPLFSSDTRREWESQHLFVTCRKAWERLLRNGRARPTRVPRVLTIDPLVHLPVTHYPPYELRAIRIRKSVDWLELVQAWPRVGSFNPPEEGS